MTLQQYPIYIPSKGRPNSHTARRLMADGVPFYVVVQPQDEQIYRERYGDHVLVLPFSSNTHGLIMARNWIKAHATEAGYKRHWQLDDNIRIFYRLTDGKRLPCPAGIALRVCEDFVDRYENVAVAGLNYKMFATGHEKLPPYYLNVHVYSCTLVLNSIPHQWRIRYNDDTDLCLQVLSDGWCTVLLNAFLADKLRTMTVKGGNTDDLYQGDGRLRMARELERQWPRVVQTRRRFGRPQHVINWKKFKSSLKLCKGIDLAKLEKGGDPYGLSIEPVKEIRNADLRAYVENKSIKTLPSSTGNNLRKLRKEEHKAQNGVASNVLAHTH